MNISSQAKKRRDAIQQGIYCVIDPFVRFLIRMGVTPNMVTTVGLLGNLAAAALIVYAALNVPFGHFSLLGVSGAVILFSSLFDMLDGRLARTGNMVSRFGAFYDSVLDRYQELATLSAITFYFMHFHYTWAALATFLSIIGSVMVSYVRARAEGLGIECKMGLMQRPERVVLTVFGLLLIGILGNVVHFDPIYLLALPQVLIALLANYTAAMRIRHVYRAMQQ